MQKIKTGLSGIKGAVSGQSANKPAAALITPQEFGPSAEHVLLYHKVIVACESAMNRLTACMTEMEALHTELFGSLTTFYSAETPYKKPLESLKATIAYSLEHPKQSVLLQIEAIKKSCSEVFASLNDVKTSFASREQAKIRKTHYEMKIAKLRENQSRSATTTDKESAKMARNEKKLEDACAKYASATEVARMKLQTQLADRYIRTSDIVVNALSATIHYFNLGSSSIGRATDPLAFIKSIRWTAQGGISGQKEIKDNPSQPDYFGSSRGRAASAHHVQNPGMDPYGVQRQGGSTVARTNSVGGGSRSGWGTMKIGVTRVSENPQGASKQTSPSPTFPDMATTGSRSFDAGSSSTSRPVPDRGPPRQAPYALPSEAASSPAFPVESHEHSHATPTMSQSFQGQPSAVHPSVSESEAHSPISRWNWSQPRPDTGPPPVKSAPMWSSSRKSVSRNTQQEQAAAGWPVGKSSPSGRKGGSFWDAFETS